jgi:hypothetical protein
MLSSPLGVGFDPRGRFFVPLCKENSPAYFPLKHPRKKATQIVSLRSLVVYGHSFVTPRGQPHPPPRGYQSPQEVIWKNQALIVPVEVGCVSRAWTLCMYVCSDKLFQGKTYTCIVACFKSLSC